jgi:hypothetical protein
MVHIMGAQALAGAPRMSRRARAVRFNRNCICRSTFAATADRWRLLFPAAHVSHSAPFFKLIFEKSLLAIAPAGVTAVGGARTRVRAPRRFLLLVAHNCLPHLQPSLTAHAIVRSVIADSAP